MYFTHLVRNHQNKLCRNLTVNGILGLFSLLSIAPVILSIPKTDLSMFGYLATIICYWRIKAFLKANMQINVVHGVKRKTLKNIIGSMLIQVNWMFYYSIFNGIFN
jgi:hypothetical protein